MAEIISGIIIDDTEYQFAANTAKTFPASNTNTPIVVFLYDDNCAEDDTLVEMLEERGLKGTFATIGNTTTMTPSNPLGIKLQNWLKKGHGVVAHGLTSSSGVKGTGNGLSTMDDDDCVKAIDANTQWMDYFNLPHSGVAYYNRWEYNPHTVSIVGRYYDYGFIFGGSGYNTPDCDLYKLTRYTTDDSNMINGAINLVDKAIGRNCVIAFGGHMSRTGKGDTYSSMEDFTRLLDYIEEKVASRQIIAMNADDAIRTMTARCNALGGVKNVQQYVPSVGQMYLSDEGIKVCSSEGTLAVFDIALSGTPSDGEIKISDISTTKISGYEGEASNNLELTLTDVTDISSALKAFRTVVYREFTAVIINATTLRLYANVAKVMTTPSVTSNTTGLTISITKIRDGVAATWI